MDAHRLSEERSLAYHAIIAERLQKDPGILDKARARVREWGKRSGDVPPYVRMWAKVLAREARSVAAFVTERSEIAGELRQSSPFAGVLGPRERWRIWRETRDRLASRQ
jgi:hypothetical protein